MEVLNENVLCFTFFLQFNASWLSGPGHSSGRMVVF